MEAKRIIARTWDEESASWGRPEVDYTNVEDFRQFDLPRLYVGATFAFDIPDGTYSDGSQHVHRHVMEGAQIYLRHNIIVEGFVSIDAFDNNEVGSAPEFVGYRKQQWQIVTR